MTLVRLHGIINDYTLLVCVYGLLACIVIRLAVWGYRLLRPRIGRTSAASLAFVFVAVCVGAVKPKKGGISYPFTDPEIRYLIDAGSYVTNDVVHVAFTRMIAPSSAPLLIDYRQVDQTNDTDWVNHTTTTFAQLANPSDIQFPAATNYDWIVYTTWTPGPTVKTNGVWHAYWGLDKKQRAYLIPVRTCVRDNTIIIATPKSRWDAEAATNDTQEVTNEAN